MTAKAKADKLGVIRVPYDRLLEVAERLKPPEDVQRSTRGVLTLPKLPNAVHEKKGKNGLLERLHELEATLTDLLTRYPKREHPKTLEIRREFEVACRRIIVDFPDVAYAEDVVDLAWKSAFYQIIEWMKKWRETNAAESITSFIKSAMEFYENLLEEIRKESSLDFDRYNPLITVSPSKRRERVAHLHSHKILMCLGDLARYEVSYLDIADYGLARKYYLKAQSLVPRNGKPYNQLAVIAALTNRKLDATYYYVRSLAVSKPYVNAREKLMALFESAKRREKHMTQEEEKGRRRNERKTTTQKKGRSSSSPREIWIFDGFQVDEEGESVEFENDGSPEKDISSPSSPSPSSSSLKGIVTRFLTLHGFLFTRVGLDRFPILLCRFLDDFQRSSATAFDRKTLLHMTSIVMYSSWNSRESSSRVYAVQLAVRYFGALCRRAHDEDAVHRSDVLPSLKILSEWMRYDDRTWMRLSDRAALPLQSFCLLINSLLSDIDDSLEDGDPSVLALDEDVLLAGFSPLQESHSRKERNLDDRARGDAVRLECLKRFAEFLTTHPEPLLQRSNNEYEVIKNGVVVAASSDSPTPKHESESQNENDVEILGEEASTDSSDAVDDDDAVGELLAKKRALAVQVAKEQKREDDIRDIVDRQKALVAAATRTPSRIRPRYLVPDTNCFVEHFDLIRRVVDGKKFAVAIPLVVVNELSGLSKGAVNDDDDAAEKEKRKERTTKVATAASLYVETCFARKSTNVSVLTSNGNRLSTLAFRDQDSSQISGNNDDIILESCHRLSDVVESTTENDVVREVVLVTDDRNLRVKARAKGVIVTNIGKFVKMAQIA